MSHTVPDDPFAHEKRPSVSFNGAAVGTTRTIKVTSHAQLKQSRDFETGEPAFWPDGNPKMSAIIEGTLDGEAVALWAAKPSAMFTAIAEAQRTAGEQIAPGGTLIVTYTGDKPHEKNPRLNPAKQYRVKYVPPTATDPFVTGDTSAAVTATTPDVGAAEQTAALANLAPEVVETLRAAGVIS